MSEHMQSQEWAEPGSRRAAPAVLARDSRSVLEAAVAQDVIPRLVAMSWVGRAPRAEARPGELAPGAVRKLVALCLDPDGQAAASFVTEARRSGLDAPAIYEQLLTPAARELGVMWENDTCSLADVTIGVLRLQNAQRLLADRPLDRAAPLGAPRALLMPVPGEQHTFGLSIVLDYFVRSGWEARLGQAATLPEALTLVTRERTELIGLSFASDDRIPDATAFVARLREVSRNKRLIIMVGGPSFVADPELAVRVGADATALDGRQAVLRANDLLQAADGRM